MYITCFILLQEERKRDKLLEQETRKRVLEQIAQDRVERAQKFPSVSDDSKSFNANAAAEQSVPKANVAKGTFTRIQFKKPTGETEMHTFNNTDNFLCVRNYVKNNVLAGAGVQKFSLATTFPKKEFGDADNDRSLDELNLTPSAVILILIAAKSHPLDVIPNSGGLLGMLSTVVMGILNPILALLGTIKNFVFRTPNGNATALGDQKRANEDSVSDNDA
jgi:UBX domain-containing protein 1/4